MTGVVIGCGGGDLHAVGDRACGPDKRRRLLDVPAFGDECGAEAQLLAAASLVHQGRRSLAASPGQQVVAQFVKRAIGAGLIKRAHDVPLLRPESFSIRSPEAPILPSAARSGCDQNAERLVSPSSRERNGTAK